MLTPDRVEQFVMQNKNYSDEAIFNSITTKLIPNYVKQVKIQGTTAQYMYPDIYLTFLHECTVQQVRFVIIVNRSFYEGMLINLWLKYQLI